LVNRFLGRFGEKRADARAKALFWLVKTLDVPVTKNIITHCFAETQ
jgi:hypothetical protein